MLHWAGRTNDLIKTGGANVSPVEIETELLAPSRASRPPWPSASPTTPSARSSWSAPWPIPDRGVDEDDVRDFLRGASPPTRSPATSSSSTTSDLVLTGNAKIRTDDLRALAIARLGRGATIMSDLLEGLRVLDLSVWRPGPYATQLLAELGAEVLKVEPPGGDPMRSYPELFASLNANKRGVVLDLKDPADLARAVELATQADVVVEGFRPGVVDRLGVGPSVVMAVNPSVIYCSVSGYGQDGPLALTPGHDVNYQALSGALAPEGGEPVRSSLPIADLAGGMAAAMAILAAAFRRQRSGEGEPRRRGHGRRARDLDRCRHAASDRGREQGGCARLRDLRHQGRPVFGTRGVDRGPFLAGAV